MRRSIKTEGDLNAFLGPWGWESEHAYLQKFKGPGTGKNSLVLVDDEAVQLIDVLRAPFFHDRVSDGTGFKN